MMLLMKERESLNVVSDQKGRPTYAKDLAITTMKMIEAIDAGKKIKGIYHFANQGETTWFDFAKKIQATAGLTCEVNPIQTKDLPILSWILQRLKKNWVFKFLIGKLHYKFVIKN